VRHCLFVDDDLNALEGLRRQLRGERERWEMRFVTGAERALVALAEAPCDVIVSGMRMQGMDGPALLARVREAYPAVVRIVLSGGGDLPTALRAVPVAHCYLTKPCEPAALRDAIERARALHDLLADPALRAVAGEIGTLPSLPAVYGALTDALVDPDVSTTTLARIVERDVAMCAKVLQLVNSGFFAARRVAGVQAGIALLGTAMLRALVLSAEVFGAATVPVPGFSLRALQQHALLTAAIASRLVPRGPRAEEAFLAAMLHDVGQIVLATRAREEFAHDLAHAGATGQPLTTVEAAHRGVTHAEVGAYLLGLWNLPYPVVEAVAHHHAPQRVGPCGLDLVAAVHVADQLAHEQTEPGRAAGLDPAYLEALGVAAELPEWRALAAAQAGTAAAA
jgi:HD-like signal output (HDOD) protein